LARKITGPPNPADEAAWRELQEMPNIGPAMASDLIRLGVCSGEDLAAWPDGRALYDALCELDGVRIDPCVWDVFEAAVDFARGGPPRPWWEYSKIRKAKDARAVSVR
jgi:hypothetical protein